VALATVAAPADLRAQEKVLCIALTAADIPRTHGQPDQGFEGNRFTGIPLYDALTHWGLSKSDAPSVLVPGLATEWAVDAADKTKGVFKLRPGVKFQDGSAFDAGAVVWNVEKVLKQDAEHVDPSQVGVTVSRMPTLRTARKIDATTVELTTSEPDSFLPGASARIAALLSGQVDWIEAPSPDALPQIRQRNFVLYANDQPHVWPWQFSFAAGSPWLDKRVRHAANLCVNREELKTLLGGLMAIPKGTMAPGHPWWGNPFFDIKYDLAAARRLMTEAGFSASRPLKVKTITSAPGSGQMQPIAMNEYLQQALKEYFFDVELDVIEWNALFNGWREGAKHANARGAHATNVTFAAMDPFFALVRFVSAKTFPPASNNWGYFGNDEFDKLIADARTSFEGPARDAALAKRHARIVEEAPFLWVAHDVGPRVLSPRVKGVVQPRSWFIDIAPMSVE